MICGLQFSANNKLLFDFAEFNRIATAETQGCTVSLVPNEIGAAVRVDAVGNDGSEKIN